MPGSARFWTPYRQAVAATVIPNACATALFFWLIMLLGGSVEFHAWVLIPFVPPLVYYGIVSEPFAGRGGPGACPRCNKSPAVVYDEQRPFWKGRTPSLWPEKTCSQCGYDLTEGADG